VALLADRLVGGGVAIGRLLADAGAFRSVEHRADRRRRDLGRGGDLAGRETHDARAPNGVIVLGRYFTLAPTGSRDAFEQLAAQLLTRAILPTCSASRDVGQRVPRRDRCDYGRLVLSAATRDRVRLPGLSGQDCAGSIRDRLERNRQRRRGCGSMSLH
jgi:hypothetical protein